MEAAFDNLKKQGKNNVDNLVKWLKESKVIDASKEQEAKARALFADVPDKTNVAYDKFKEVVKKLADEFKKNFDGISKQLADVGPKFLQGALGGATSKLKDLVMKK